MIPKYGVAILLVLLAATSLRATTRATDYPGSISMLLGVESVRSDLALDAKQKSRLNVLRKELRSKSQVLTQKKSKVPLSRLTADQKLFSLIDTNNSGALAVLTPEQSVRFHEIQNQALGFTMLVSPKVQKQLSVRCQAGDIDRENPTQGAGFRCRDEPRLRGGEIVSRQKAPTPPRLPL